jgi:hypothetical protein
VIADPLNGRVGIGVCAITSVKVPPRSIQKSQGDDVDIDCTGAI